MMKLKFIAPLMALFLFAATSCDKDNEPQKPITTNKSEVLDVRDYGSWVYVNLKTGETQTVKDWGIWNYMKSEGHGKPSTLVKSMPAPGKESDITIKWDIAFHRYNEVKTNGATVVETSATAIADLKEIPATGYKGDEIKENTMIVDMSKMMQGIVGYAAKTPINPELTKWLKKIPQPGMPPFTLELSKKVYVVKCKDGGVAKLLIKDYRNAVGEKGYVDLEWEYTGK